MTSQGRAYSRFKRALETAAHNLTLLDQARAVAEAWAHRAGQKEGRRRAPFLRETGP